MLFSELEKITEGSAVVENNIPISSFSIDTRSLAGRDGEVFVAIKGPKRDGHDFIEEAIKSGTTSFIVEELPQKNGANFLQVDSSIGALQRIAAYHRSRFDLPVIGITGSNGKTIAKEWLSTILSTRWFVAKSPKSFNSQIGVPLSVLELRSNHDVAVFEAGISQEGEMINLQDIIRPTIGVLTSIGPAHDEGFASTDEKILEKLRLFKDSDKLICRLDTPWFAKTQLEIGVERIVSWSLSGEGDYPVVWSRGSIKVGDHFYHTTLSHPAELENITHCIVASLELGLTREEIQEGLNSIRSVPMRLELKRGINDCYLLDDSYNNDLIGLKTALDFLDTQHHGKKKTLILSDILNTGKSSAALYLEVSEMIRDKGIQRIIGVGPQLSEHRKTFGSMGEFFESTNDLLANVPEFKDEIILVKGARPYQLERIVQLLEEKIHGTVLEVSIDALRHNLNQYRALLSEGTKMMVMVKANAYGSGILEVANFLQHENVDMLGVAYVDEAIQLRQNGIKLPILIMNPHVESFSQFQHYDLEAEIFSVDHLERLIAENPIGTSIHIKIETGMHRLGFSPQEIPELLKILQANPQIKVASVFTHFSSSDAPDQDDYTRLQAKLFEQAYEKIAAELGYTPTRHACNSPAMVRFPEYHFEMVRLGIGLHGFDPTSTLPLRPSSSLKTIISHIQNLDEGQTVGYGRRGKLGKKGQVAVLPLGYEDGVSRVFSNGNLQVSVNGRRCPTVGNICMDMTMVDVTGTGAQVGDQVTIFGEEVPISELAEAASTIPYEILTNISSRVKRIFVSE